MIRAEEQKRPKVGFVIPHNDTRIQDRDSIRLSFFGDFTFKMVVFWANVLLEWSSPFTGSGFKGSMLPSW